MDQAQNVTLLDGGMGQELMARWDRPATRLWAVDVLAERPDIVEAAHVDFLHAGAEVITLGAYPATPSRLAPAGREAEFETLQANALRAAGRARDRAGPNARIAGCLPPLPGSYRPGERSTADVALEEYRRIVEAQADGADLFICETLPSVEEARLATRAAREAGKPVWTALTVDETDGRFLRSGSPVEDGAAAARAEGAEVVLINCSPPEPVTTALDILLESGAPAGAYANGFATVEPLTRGETVDSLETREDLGPDEYAAIAMGWIEAGAHVVGGCCEVGPAHIAAIASRLGERTMRARA
ncbi:homocysteine S-methyltransferase [Marinicauda salina]|uniref:Homocysteine S-methyltransferase n=1 Tax=Marinicauda salina TaxID=2135793 RepID=A0A2U2BQZ5_9PROT|nr:homocysteine S-methyltransferase family protein [Marinicauda salina]PWE16431.1 homocysteine S-methyltransferase [Marinicauda salina]